ncbi:MAG: dehydrogenase [Chloroflexi bacterium]|nr:dehydrogenase [Chloroflexota bacterium]
MRWLADLGMGAAGRSTATDAWQPRLATADRVVVSVCPYCAVGCSQLVSVRGDQIINIEGNPASPINQGTLCPKGAATFGLTVNPQRVTTVKYRAPHADHWEDRPLDWAMDRIARLVDETRAATWRAADAAGTPINQCAGIASLGGATLDNEENYLIKKLFTAGLGMVWVENQARV